MGLDNLNNLNNKFITDPYYILSAVNPLCQFHLVFFRLNSNICIVLYSISLFQIAFSIGHKKLGDI